MQHRLANVFTHIDRNRQAFLDRLFDYLQRPSISAHGLGIGEVADYIAGVLSGIGLKTQGQVREC